MPAPPSAVVRDPARLAALQRTALLDTGAEEDFDELTRVACRALKVPVGLVSLVDADRQFFKSCIGLPEPWASARQTPLSHSFCQHVAASGTPLLIEDARVHPLVRDNLAIADLGVIAYAGIPLRTSGGHTLGTLCVIDHQPRQWHPAEIQLLQSLATCVLNRIELGVTVRALEGEVAERRASGQRLAVVLDSAIDAIITMDGGGLVTSWNAQATAIFGWPAADAVGHLMTDLIIPSRQREEHRRGLARFLSSESGPILRRRVEVTAVCRDGREFPVELTVTPARIGDAWQFSAFIRDLTEAKRAEEALRTATERFQLVARASNDAVWDWDLVAGTHWWSEGLETLFGYRRAEVEPGPESWRTRLHPDDHDRVIRGIDEVLAGGGITWADDYRFLRADGTYAEIFDRGYLIRDGQGRPVRMVGAMVDVTSRRRAEQVQRAVYRIAEAANTAADLRELLREVHDIVGELMPARNFYVAMHDAEAGRLSFPYFVDEQEPPPAPRQLGRGLTEYVLRTGEALLATPTVSATLRERGEIVLLGADSIDWVGVPLRARGGCLGVLVVQTYTPGIRYGIREKEILEFVSTQVAMAIERKRVEEELKERETRYRLLFDANPEAMFVYDLESLRFLAVNDAAIRRYGYSADEFRGMSIRDIRPPGEVDRLERGLRERPASGALALTDVRHCTRSGDIIEVEVLSDSITFDGRAARLVLALDVSERKRLEGQLRQAQKMEAVGQLAGGIAHDFNNLLTAITGYAELLLDALAPGDPRREDVREISRATTRAASLTQQLLAYSRKQVLQPRVIDLNAVVRHAEGLLRRLIGEHISLVTLCDPELGVVLADATQLEQVILNLAVNARDAMPNGGQLRIESRNVELAEGHDTEGGIMEPGRYVLLTVSDSGMGMDEATRARLFEPFFTTKGLGKGTGLGLSTVYGIIKQSGGFVWVQSAVGQGTTFRIYLPRVEAEVEPPRPAAPSASTPGGSETVLLVEDEPALRAVARRSLVRQGYVVLEASNAEAALTVAAGYSGPVDLLVTDIVMPGLNGQELARRLTAARPGLRVLYISGYSEETIAHHGVLDAGVAYLQKPFSPDALGRRVRAMLDA